MEKTKKSRTKIAVLSFGVITAILSPLIFTGCSWTNNNETQKPESEIVLELKDQLNDLQLKYQNALVLIKETQERENDIKQKNELLIVQVNDLNNLIDQKTARITELENKGQEDADAIETLQAEKTNLQNEITSLTTIKESLKSTISANEQTIATLQSEKIELQNEITRLNGLIAGYEDIAQGTCEVDFYVGETLSTVKVVRYNNTLNEEVTLPESNEYRFEGWARTPNGAVVDVNTIKITERTSFYAILTPKYKVNYISDNSPYFTEYVVQGEYPTAVGNPTKENCGFIGWVESEDSDILVDPINQVVTENKTYYAKFKEMYEWVEVPRSGEALGFSGLTSSGQTNYGLFNNFVANNYVKTRITFNEIKLLNGAMYSINENFEIVNYSSSVTCTFTLEEGQSKVINLNAISGNPACQIKITFQSWNEESKKMTILYECISDGSSYTLMGAGLSKFEVYKLKND